MPPLALFVVKEVTANSIRRENLKDSHDLGPPFPSLGTYLKTGTCLIKDDFLKIIPFQTSRLTCRLTRARLTDGEVEGEYYRKVKADINLLCEEDAASRTDENIQGHSFCDAAMVLCLAQRHRWIGTCKASEGLCAACCLVAIVTNSSLQNTSD